VNTTGTATGTGAATASRRFVSAGVVLALTASFLVALLGLGAARASAASPHLPSFGVNYHATWSDYTDAERNTVVDELSAAHAGWVRIDIGWQTIQENSPNDHESWYVGIVDSAVAYANAHGLKVLGMLWRTPSWACGGCTNPYSPPSNPATYAKFATWAAQRWAGKIQAWEVWNEPNEDGFWSGTDQQYVDLLRAAYPAFHAGDPNTQVVIGGPAYNDTNWLTNAYRLGAGGSFDVMATHPYQGMANEAPETPDTTGTNIWLLSHVQAVHDLMVANGDSAKPIWFTEFGWSSHANTANEDPWNEGVTARQQGDYLVRAMRFVGQHYPWVTNVFWYNERDTDMGSAQQDGYGLLTRGLAPKPAYVAVSTLLAGTATSGGSRSTRPACTISGTSGDDALRGTPRNDVICGGGGNDVIHGRGGSDTIEGGLGHDTLYGGAGNDTMAGGRGNDRMFGGLGADTITGGTGSDSAAGGHGTDRLQSFDHVAGNDAVFGGFGADRCVTDHGDAQATC
jgi:polysaccharide biosynthesis protein PslG